MLIPGFIAVRVNVGAVALKNFLSMGAATAAIAASLIIAVPYSLCQSAAPANNPDGEKPSFEVVSIKKAESCVQTFSPSPGAQLMIGSGPPKYQSGGRYTACGALKMLLADAWRTEDRPMEGGPEWIDKLNFQIDARAGESASPEQMRVMVQNLLEERFKLKFHRENRGLDVYSLVVAKNGPKLKEARDEKGNIIKELPPPPEQPPDPKEMAKRLADLKSMKGRPGSVSFMSNSSGETEFRGSAMSMKSLTQTLRNTVRRRVVDKTNLPGLYDIEMHFAQDNTSSGRDVIAGPGVGSPGGSGSSPAPVAQPSGPSIFTALQEQLGLKLEPENVPTEFIVIDGADKPSEN